MPSPTRLPTIGPAISFQERHKETGDIQLDAIPSSSAFSLSSPWIPPEHQENKDAFDLSRPRPGRPTERLKNMASYKGTHLDPLFLRRRTSSSPLWTRSFTFSLHRARASLYFIALLRRQAPPPSDERFKRPTSHRRTMSMSGSRGTTYKCATSSMVSSIPEGGSLACKQCGALICSLQSLVSSVSCVCRLFASRVRPDQFLISPLFFFFA